ncbi:bifunctional hydroxymethylpyrimidine kinase/phosphomethylpyrimidine kinase [Robbsia andropogonis]|uniref:bifunctional hydroxymethylpyrimidine kinase/phosphomethylpyrimidine kinase n=1 Tax=Robbsia andropogonis TaxID=28092 RepID=UPI000AC58B85|nr:bifunctional hydroxymethylpyrimidine kinase/phosphomethylpyrimidine kinase [Robbsia andropogonis]
MAHRIANILTIAGSDSSGGAGIQADLKTFSALGAYGASVITALTAQNTRGVHAVFVPPVDIVAAQLDAVFRDLRLDAVKIGMLASRDNVLAVAEALQRWRPRFVVLDPVMVSSSGRRLLASDAIIALREVLIPHVTLLTPNLAEAAVLLDQGHAVDDEQMVAQGQALRALGVQAVLMKGGHLAGEQSPDWLVEAGGKAKFGAARVPTRSTHGTGCTLSAAIAVLRPQRLDLPTAVSDAKSYLTNALIHADRLSVGGMALRDTGESAAAAPARPAPEPLRPDAPDSHAEAIAFGHGPVHHFHPFW